MFPHYIETTTFGISCDAYTNLKETLTRHKTMVADYLDKNYDRVSTVPDHTLHFNVVFHILDFQIPYHLLELSLLFSLVLLIIHPTDPLGELRHQTTVAQTPRRNPPGPS